MRKYMQVLTGNFFRRFIIQCRVNESQKFAQNALFNYTYELTFENISFRARHLQGKKYTI
jgi:hypothetical protein